MKTIDFLDKTQNQEYARYYTAMVKGKMIPLGFRAWAEAKLKDEQRWHEESTD